MTGAPMENLIIITDPNKDPDDLVTLIAANTLAKEKIAQIKGIIVTLGNFTTRKKRALYAKGALKLMGLDIPVAVGMDYKYASKAREINDQVSLHAEELPHERAGIGDSDIIYDTESFLLKTVQEADDNTLTFIIIAGMRDFYTLIRNYPYLVKQKTKRVSIMGGIGFDWKGTVTASKTSYNNTTDIEASQGTYQILQAFDIPTVIINREAVYKAPLTKEFYIELNKTGHYLASHLYGIHRQFIIEMFDMIAYGEVLKPRTLSWFFKTFTTLSEDSSERNIDVIWDHTWYVHLYDPMTLVAAIGLYDSFFVEQKRGNFIFKTPKCRKSISELFYRLTSKSLKA